MRSKSSELILHLLSDNQPLYISGEVLAETAGISRAAVWKHIKSLRQQGYQINAVPRKGYALTNAADILFPSEIIKLVKDSNIHFDIKYYSHVDSTNRIAGDLARKGAAEGTVVVAEEQSSGKGRLDRSWVSPVGGIWLSLVMRPEIPVSEIARITLMMAVTITQVLHEFGIDASIKWPNDILVKNKKVCGILLELTAQQDRIDFLVVGIGINANFPIETLPEDMRKRSTTLAGVLGHPVNRAQLIARLLCIFDLNYQKLSNGGWHEIKREWLKYSAMKGDRLEIHAPHLIMEGKFVGIDDYGALQLKLDSGAIKSFTAGDVTTKKP